MHTEKAKKSSKLKQNSRFSEEKSLNITEKFLKRVNLFLSSVCLMTHSDVTKAGGSFTKTLKVTYPPLFCYNFYKKKTVVI